jgi:integration host factor subunit alpha
LEVVVTKGDIIENVSTQLGLTKRESQDLVESAFSLLKSTLEKGEDVKISGFGKFEVKQKNDRRGRNPQTGESITIAARRILSFKPSKHLREAINRETTL